MAHIVLQNPSQPVADFSVSGTIITIGGAVIDCAALQTDSQEIINVYRDKAGDVKLNPKNGGTCLAIVRIPARHYADQAGPNDEHGNPTVVSVPQPLDPNAISVELWPLV